MSKQTQNSENISIRNYNEAKILTMRIKAIKESNLEDYNFLVEEIDSLLNKIALTMSVLDSDVINTPRRNSLLITLNRALDSNSHYWLKHFCGWNKSIEITDNSGIKTNNSFWVILKNNVTKIEQIGSIRYSAYQFFKDLDNSFSEPNKPYLIPKFPYSEPKSTEIEENNNSTSKNNDPLPPTLNEKVQNTQSTSILNNVFKTPQKPVQPVQPVQPISKPQEVGPPQPQITENKKHCFYPGCLKTPIVKRNIKSGEAIKSVDSCIKHRNIDYSE